jgi:hypothetical protein
MFEKIFKFSPIDKLNRPIRPSIYFRENIRNLIKQEENYKNGNIFFSENREKYRPMHITLTFSELIAQKNKNSLHRHKKQEDNTLKFLESKTLSAKKKIPFHERYECIDFNPKDVLKK